VRAAARLTSASTRHAPAGRTGAPPDTGSAALALGADARRQRRRAALGTPCGVPQRGDVALCVKRGCDGQRAGTDTPSGASACQVPTREGNSSGQPRLQKAALQSAAPVMSSARPAIFFCLIMSTTTPHASRACSCPTKPAACAHALAALASVLPSACTVSRGGATV